MEKQEQPRVEANEETKKISISFTTINVRLYPTIIGDNPATYRGPPLEMDWKPVRQYVIPLDEYESNRESERRKKFVLTPKTRVRLLESLGFSRQEINRAVTAVAEARYQREETIKGLKHDKRLMKRQERFAFFQRLLTCKAEETLDYSDVPSPGKDNPFYVETRKVQPMFSDIPCMHCSPFACTGEGSDWPATVNMFKCGGTRCKEINPKVCPVTGKDVEGVGYRASSKFEVSDFFQ